MNPLRNLLRRPDSESAAKKQEAALALRAYEAMMAWHGFRQKYWTMLPPIAEMTRKDDK